MDQNFLLLISCIIFHLFGAVFCSYLGKKPLETYTIVSLISVNILSGKVIEFVHLQTTVGTIFYATIFLCTDIYNEKYGRKAAQVLVLHGFFAVFLFNIVGKISTYFVATSNSIEISSSINIIFGTTTRIFAASLLAYLVAQTWDVFIYNFILKKTGKKLLWVRNNFSTVSSQFIDSLVFFGVAFGGTNNAWFKLAIVGFFLKTLIALVDTPFIYLSERLNKT